MIVAKVFGAAATIQTFHSLPMTVQNKGMRIALNAAGGVIRDAAVSNAPRQSGLLRRSIKVKVRVPNASYNAKHHGRPAYAVVGPARRFVQAVAMTAKGARTKSAAGIAKAHEKGLTVRVRRPSRYAHLVERGTKRGVVAQRFLARAVASHGESAKAKMIQKLRDTIAVWAIGRASRIKVAA